MGLIENLPMPDIYRKSTELQKSVAQTNKVSAPLPKTYFVPIKILRYFNHIIMIK